MVEKKKKQILEMYKELLEMASDEDIIKMYIQVRSVYLSLKELEEEIEDDSEEIDKNSPFN